MLSLKRNPYTWFLFVWGLTVVAFGGDGWPDNATESLFVSVYEGKTDELTTWLDSGRSPHAERPDGMTLVQQAAMCGNVEALAMLIDHGVRLNLEIPNDVYVYALWGGHQECIQLMELEGFIPNGESGAQPYIATMAQVGATDAIRYLVKQGVDVDTRCSRNFTPLMYAATFGQLEAAKVLVELGADVNAHYNSQKTALYYAQKYEHTELVNFLLSAGTEVEPVSMEKAAAMGDLVTLKKLISSGEPITLSVLYDAMENEQREVVEYITSLPDGLTSNGQIFKSSNEGTRECFFYQASLEALSNGFEDLAFEWIGKEFPYDYTIPERETDFSLLKTVYKHVSAKAMLEFIDKGVPCDSYDGAAALAYAAFKKDDSTMKKLLDRGVALEHDGLSDSAVERAAGNNNVSGLRMLIDAGADIGHTGHDSPLNRAARNGHVKAMILLLEAGAKVDEVAEDAIVSDSSFGPVSKSGAVISATNETALMVAAKYGQPRAVELLLKYGADSARTNFRGKTAYDIAAERGHEACAELLRPE